MPKQRKIVDLVKTWPCASTIKHVVCQFIGLFTRIWISCLVAATRDISLGRKMYSSVHTHTHRNVVRCIWDSVTAPQLYALPRFCQLNSQSATSAMTGITASTFVQPADFAKELQQYLGDKLGGPGRNVMNARASNPPILDRSPQNVYQSKSNAVFPESTHSF